jgi:2-C-methyl-D-erythritol 4-phosphate cytidylyltransferase
MRHWVIVPAAGSGRRLGADVPKQYLPLAGRLVIEWAIEPLLGRDGLLGICVALAADDRRFAQLPLSRHPGVEACAGGRERSDSVLRALRAIESRAAAEDWVLVHDAARPCLERADVDALLAAVGADPVGGLLATPLADTLKHADDAVRSDRTVAREDLWRALTPQAFRYGVLREALERAEAEGAAITDEAAAVERRGLRPMLVDGRPENLKITRPRDLELAAAILMARGAGE